jgi:hypothetical protein
LQILKTKNFLENKNKLENDAKMKWDKSIDNKHGNWWELLVSMGDIQASSSLALKLAKSPQESPVSLDSSSVWTYPPLVPTLASSTQKSIENLFVKMSCIRKIASLPQLSYWRNARSITTQAAAALRASEKGAEVTHTGQVRKSDLLLL